jgi:molybdopterin-containing oxidoreductase family iron-sulfur binding subunit
MTLEEYSNHQPERRPRALTMYEPATSLGETPAPHQWAMTIDLSACVGCGACMVACQAENNVPVVGRDDVLRGREMHWLRIDWYAPRASSEPLAIAQPMLCQHCEKAPCEYVCPVEATVHSRDGLNEMIYNRCVGTRFCSNNCPYKVRRFNWFDFNARLSDTEQLARNPDVTVRERGVMEKCTFCVQRIREAEISARADNRPLPATEVRTACQQACPTHAIVFGSLTEADSPLMRARNSSRAYAVLDDLGTEPRVRYLMRITNPNPDLERQT